MADEKRDHFYLYVSEIAAIIKAAYSLPGTDEHTGGWGEFFETIFWSGCRPGEVRALTPGQLPRVGSVVTLDASMSGQKRSTTKSGARRFPFLPEPVVARLRARADRLGLGPNDLLWVNNKGGAMWPSTYKKAWLKAIAIAKVTGNPDDVLESRRQVPIPYDLRAAHVSHLLGCGIPLVDVQAQVGHEDKQTTDYYTVVASAGAEDPLVVEARSAEVPRVRSEVIPWLYRRAQAEYGVVAADRAR